MVAFPVAVIRHHEKSNLREKGSFRLRVHHAGRPKQQELEAVGHIASTAHKHRAMNEYMPVLTLFYPSYMVQDSLPREWSQAQLR